MFYKFVLIATTPTSIAIFYSAFAWLFVFLVSWTIWAAIREFVGRSGRMHQIPCAQCRFFTNHHQLKCTLHPGIAMSEAAIDCPDFQSAAAYRLSSIHSLNLKGTDSQARILSDRKQAISDGAGFSGAKHRRNPLIEKSSRSEL